MPYSLSHTLLTQTSKKSKVQPPTKQMVAENNVFFPCHYRENKLARVTWEQGDLPFCQLYLFCQCKACME